MDLMKRLMWRKWGPTEDQDPKGFGATWQKKMEKDVRPFFADKMTAGEVMSGDGVPLAYRLSTDFLSLKKPPIVILPGWAENIMKYAELAFDLSTQGNPVLILDHRGQGLSGREVEHPNLSWVKDFHTYVADLHLVLSKLFYEAEIPKVFIAAHSMGGAIATHYATAHPERVTAMGLSAPMYKIDSGFIPYRAMESIARIGIQFGKAKEFVVGHGPWRGNLSFADNVHTHSAARHKLTNDLMDQHENFRICGASYQWLWNSLEQYHDLKPSQLKVPTLIYSATDDCIVSNQAQHEFAEACPVATLIECPGAYHELFVETDSIRQPVVDGLLEFFRN